MPVINGTAVNFGFTGTNGITITSVAGTLLQNVDYSQEADKEDVRSGQGDIVERSWYDLHSKATLEWVITGTGLANAIANTTLTGASSGPTLTPGTIIAITACASDPDLVGTTWEVQSGASIKKSNTGAARMSVPLEKRAGITAVAGA